MDRTDLLAYLRETLFAPGDREKARADALCIADCLRRKYAAEVYGIGSAFESLRTFRRKSDIDLVVKGIPPDKFIYACLEADELSEFEVNLIPWETSNELVKDIVATNGVKL